VSCDRRRAQTRRRCCLTPANWASRGSSCAAIRASFRRDDCLRPTTARGANVKRSPEIIDLLNEVLAAELVAINQYFLHAKMQQNWGFDALGKHTREESIDEMRHAEEIVHRILFLEGLPNLQRLDKLRVGQTVKEQLESDLALEYAAVKRFNDGIQLCRDKGDNATEQMLVRMLSTEEEHVDWIETQLGLIERLGENAYLAEQLRG
jgi:bacterioferritin